jgi:hypothetical protein
MYAQTLISVTNYMQPVSRLSIAALDEDIKTLIKELDILVNEGSISMKNLNINMTDEEHDTMLRNAAIIISNTVRHALITRNSDLMLNNTISPHDVDLDTSIIFTMAAICTGFAIRDRLDRGV